MYSMYPFSRHELKGCEHIRTYVLGGNAVVTLLSPTGVHHTYAFRHPKHAEDFPSGVMFVYVLVADNVWKYVGMLKDKRLFFTRSSRYAKASPIFKGAKYIVRMMYDTSLITSMRIFHEGVCSVCGRVLTNPTSIEIGIGPRCRKRVI